MREIRIPLYHDGKTPNQEESQPVNKVLIVVGDATETVDTLYPYLRLQEDGVLAENPSVLIPPCIDFHLLQ